MNNVNLKHLGMMIRQLRKNAGLNQLDLVDSLTRAGVPATQSHISKIEAGKTAAGADLLLALMRLFGVTPNELFGVASGPSASASSALRLIERLPAHRQQLYMQVLEPLVASDVAIREQNLNRWRAVLTVASQMGGDDLVREIAGLMEVQSGGIAGSSEESLLENLS